MSRRPGHSSYRGTVDAWFDCATAAPGWPFVVSLSLALAVEPPLAALSPTQPPAGSTWLLVEYDQDGVDGYRLLNGGATRPPAGSATEGAT